MFGKMLHIEHQLVMGHMPFTYFVPNNFRWFGYSWVIGNLLGEVVIEIRCFLSETQIKGKQYSEQQAEMFHEMVS